MYLLVGMVVIAVVKVVRIAVVMGIGFGFHEDICAVETRIDGGVKME